MMRWFLVFILVSWAVGASAQELRTETPGRIGIWTAPGKLGDTGNASAPSNLTVGGNLNVLGTASSIPQISGPFIVQGGLSGSMTVGNMPGDFGGIYTLGGVNVTSDTATNTTPSGGLAAWAVHHAFGGAGAGDGARVGIWTNLNQIGPLPPSTEPFHTGIMANVNANYSLGGSGTGELYGYGAQVAAGPGATGMYGITGGEIDVALNGSATMVEGFGIANVPLSYGNPTQHGQYYDAGLGIWAGGSCGAGSGASGSGCAGFDAGISFGRFDSYFPIGDHGTIIQTIKGVGTTMKADWGIRFVDNDGVTPVQFTYCAFDSAGVCIDGRGNYKLDTSYPTIQLRDEATPSPITNGGLVRLTSDGSPSNNHFEFQVNTAPAGDFSTGVHAIGFGNDGVFIGAPFHLTEATPASSTAPCMAGQIAFDSNYVYTCVASNTWRRAATTTW